MSMMERIVTQPVSMRRLLALCVLATAAVLAWWLVVEPLSWLVTSQDKWRAQTRLDLARSRGDAHELAAIRESLARLPADPLWSQLYRPQDGTDTAAAVQRDISQLCSAAGIALESAVRTPSETDGVLSKYGLRVTVSTTTDRLRIFIEGLRKAPHYLRMDRLKVSAPQMQLPEQNPTLTIAMDIAGYARASDQPKGART